MKIGSLFSGIGGLELGLEWSGLGEVVWQVEQSEFCRSVLAKHWPDVTRHEDVRAVGAHNLATVDLVCGGFPCQDVSSAGKGAGLAGKRSGLWYQYARILGELGPEWCVVENVASGASRWVDEVVQGLAVIGYEALPIPLSAADVGAPHLRRRVFIVGRKIAAENATTTPRITTYAARIGRGSRWRQPKAAWQTNAIRNGRRHYGFERTYDIPEPGIFILDDGVSRKFKVDNLKSHLRASGNAVVPQCAEVIGWVVRELAGC